jgi:hypothetical protein
MARWVKVSSGWVNLGHVASVRENDAGALYLYAAQGTPQEIEGDPYPRSFVGRDAEALRVHLGDEVLMVDESMETRAFRRMQRLEEDE